MGKLTEPAEYIALGRHLDIYVPYVQEIFPEVIMEGLTEQDWYDLKLMTTNNTDCKNIVIENLNRLNLLETFFRLQVLDWEKKEIDLFLKRLENSLLLSLAIRFKLIRLNMEKIRKWDEDMKLEEFERAKKMLREGYEQHPYVKSLCENRNPLISFFVALLAMLIIWFLALDLDLIARLTIIGTIASVLGLLLALWRRPVTPKR